MSDQTEHPGFSETERRLLASVLDEIIPPRDDGKVPGAGQLGVARHVEETLRNLPDLSQLIAQGLSDLEALARSRNGSGFATLPRPEKLELLREQAFVLPLTFHACAGYYQDSRVVEALGLETRPPHPEGYPVEESDLTLLEAVRRRPKLYREC